VNFIIKGLKRYITLALYIVAQTRLERATHRIFIIKTNSKTVGITVTFMNFGYKKVQWE